MSVGEECALLQRLDLLGRGRGCNDFAVERQEAGLQDGSGDGHG